MKKILLICIISCLVVCTACSDTQNGSKEDSGQSSKGKISITVLERSTTDGTQTAITLDKKIEKTTLGSLKLILTQGTDSKKSFDPSTLEAAEKIFLNNGKTAKNHVEVSLSYMKSNNVNESLVVAQIEQEILLLGERQRILKGQIYFDTTGKAIGFDIDDTQTALEG